MPLPDPRARPAGAERAAELEGANEALRNNAAEHERAERAMRDSQQPLQSIVDNAATVITVKRLDRHYALVNRRFEDVFHIERADALCRTDDDLFAVKRADACSEADERVLAGEVVEREEERLRLVVEAAHRGFAVKITMPLAIVEAPEPE
jgi:PAS domain-containing protein